MNIHYLSLLHTPINSPEKALNLLATKLSCGFPSPADDYMEKMPSIDELLVKHPAATILAKATGDSMIERGIIDGSLLVVDRSITPSHDSTIVASIAGELTIKILDLKNRLLKPANRHLKPISLPDDIEMICEGVVTYCITPQQNFSFSV